MSVARELEDLRFFVPSVALFSPPSSPFVDGVDLLPIVFHTHGSVEAARASWCPRNVSIPMKMYQ